MMYVHTGGVLTLTPLAGGPAVTGNGTSTITLFGRLDHINYLMQSLIYKPTLAYTGPDALELAVDDLGKSGNLGGAKQARKTIALQVT